MKYKVIEYNSDVREEQTGTCGGAGVIISRFTLTTWLISLHGYKREM